MKTRTAIVLGLMVVIMVGCASSQAVKPHRPAIYEKTKTDTAVDIAASVPLPLPIGMIAGAAYAHRELEKWLRIYPECREWVWKSENPLEECVRVIDIAEERIDPYVPLPEYQRADMDSVMRGGQ